MQTMRTMRGTSATPTRLRTVLPHPAGGSRSRAILPSFAVLVAAFLGPVAIAKSAPPASPGQDTVSAPSTPARDWAVDCANNEVLVIQHPNSYLRYRMHEVTDKVDVVRDQIETPEGSVARLILRDGKPLSPDEDSAERSRLNFMLASPASFAHHIKSENANKKYGVDLLKLMPDAMIWSYTPNQPQLPNQPSGDPPLIVLDFKPNPKWSPPTIPSEGLTGLEGRAWIDPRSRRLVRIEGDIFQPVNALGMLLHLAPGGKVLLEQANAGSQRWIPEHIDMQFVVRVLLLKNVKLHTRYDTPPASFQPVAAMTYQQAIKILLDTPLPTH
jgi:hypothetical protein